MLSSDASCSDCKLEMIHKRWSKLLLKWINKCCEDSNQKVRVRRLSPNCLSDIMTTYKDDVCDDDFDRAMLCTDDIEPFIKYKYPILRLRYLSEEQDVPKKLYIMTSILLFHCCINSQTGVVHEDIYRNLSKVEQELVLKFCENLCEMETTINNIEVAIQDAFEFIFSTEYEPNQESSFNALQKKISSDTAAQMSKTSTIKSSLTTLPSDGTNNEEMKIPSVKFPPSKFASSVTVLPSVVNTSTISYSDSMGEESVEKDMYVDSEEIESSTLVENIKDKTKKEPKRDGDQRDNRDKNNQRSKKEYDKKKQHEETLLSRQQAFENNDFIQILHQQETVSGQDESGKRPTSSTASSLNINQDKEIILINSSSSDLDKQTPGKARCPPKCSCTKCTAGADFCSGDSASAMPTCECSSVAEEKPAQPVDSSKLARLRFNRKMTALVVAVLLFLILVGSLSTIIPLLKKKKPTKEAEVLRIEREAGDMPFQENAWKCKKNLCQKIYKPTSEEIFTSYSRCSLSCMGPNIWPIPIGKTQFSTKIIALATNKLEYKLQTVSSDNVRRYLAQAFKLFIGDLAKLERKGRNYKTDVVDLEVQKIKIQVDVESDPDPRMRLNTEEAYELKLETIDDLVVIKILGSSFCGVRHGLETLTQMILLDESTGYLITVSNAHINDAPSYKYRGLMIDTGRNYIPVDDLMRTIDAMATVKLNTFHWRISDVTSFPLFLPQLPQLFEYGAYDRSMVYTKNDVETVVKRAGVRGIRVLIEIAAPGPVGRPWSWSAGATCPSKDNKTCDNVLCMTLELHDSVLSALQILYEEILDMTKVDDIFHLSNGVFSHSNCFNLMYHRDGFLDRALDSLKRANKGFLPKLPIIWYTSQLNNDFEAKSWERFGVQLNEWNSISSEQQILAKFKVIHSSKWDLSCEMKKQRCNMYRNWQDMYSWKSWKNLKTFTVEGGEAVLWTDLVDAGNLDYHIWPRTAAVAERLWSDLVANSTVDGSVYVRLNNQRSRMLHSGVKIPAIWPAWCTYNPGPCLEKIR